MDGNVLHCRSELSIVHSFQNFYIPTVCLTLSNAVNVVFVSFVNVMFVFK